MNAEVSSDIPVQKLKINEQCATDSSVCGDLQNGRAGDCNGVKLEGAVREVLSGNGKEDLDGAYVFINGIDTASQDSVEHNSVEPAQKEDFGGDNGVVKVNGFGDRGDFEEHVTTDKAANCCEGVTHDKGENNLLVQVPTEGFVGNNELKVNGCNGVGNFGLQKTEEKAIDFQPQEGLSNGSFVNEVKPETEVMASLRNSGLESAVHGEDDDGGVGIVAEEETASEEIPDSNESSDVAASALNDRKEQQYENTAEVSDHVGEALNAEPEEIAESYESSDVAAPASSDTTESLENGEELSDQVCEVPKAEPEHIPESHESRDAASAALCDRDEPLDNAGVVSGKFDEGQKAESEEAESYESSDGAAPTQNYTKEPLEDAGEVSDQLDEFSKAEPAVDDSINGDSKLQKECGCCMDDVEENLPIERASSEPNIVVDEQESVEIERKVVESDLVLGQQDLTDSTIPSSSDVLLENVSDQNVPMVSQSSESGEVPSAYDSGHELTMSVMMQPTADATSIADEPNPDPVVDEPEIASSADKSEPVQTPTEVEHTPASESETAPSHGEAETAPSHGEAETAPSHGEAETAPSHGKAETAPLYGEPDIAPSPVELESASIIVEAESDPALLKTESPMVEPQIGSPSSGEPLIEEVATKSLDLGQEAKEQNAYTESLPSVDNGNVLDDTADKVESPVHADVEEKSVTVADEDEGSAPVIDYSGPAAELDKGQIVSSDMDLQGVDKDASLVPNDISSCCTTNAGESEICFGSISQKELSALPTTDRNTDELSSTVHAPSSEQELTKTTNKVEKRFFNYLIRVPRYDDRDHLREQINAAQPEVDEKTRIRDAIKIEREKSRALRDELSKEVDAAIKEEDAARESLNSKREEVALVQEMVKAAKSTDDIDSRIRSMEHTMHHVTIDLKEEKQIMREIKQLRQSREQLSSNLGKQSVEQREQNEGRLKILRKEEELLRDNLSRAELVTRTAKKNYYNEKNRFWELVDQFKTANAVRQDAYQLLKELKDQLRKKEDRFFTYRKDQKLCFDLMNNKQRDAVSDKCVQQVEDLIKLWVEDLEFRDDYIRCNARSTLRRLGTSDGRVLGPNEEPQNVPAYTPFVRPPVKDTSSPPLPSPPQSVQVEARSIVAEPSSTKPVEQQKKQTTSKANNAVKPSEIRVVEPVSMREEVVVEEVAEEPERTSEEEEMARKAEELRKEEEAAKLKEQRRLEEKAKAEAALERKKRNAERAQARAAAKAQKEAELKEKEREKRLKKKERKNGGGSAEASSEVESAPSSETSAETPKELETTTGKDRGVEVVTKRPQKPSHFIKQQNRVKSIPPPLRNRGKRRMQPWMWGVMVALVPALVFILFGRDLF